jgi:hypothetical protein
MFLPIHIPLGARRVATAQGSVLKVVSCEQCRETYGYLVDLEATGEDLDLFFLEGEASAERARQNAEENLASKSERCLLAVPCPNCGHYQEAMVNRMKEDASVNWMQITGGVLATVSLLSLPFNLGLVWPVAAAGAVIGLALMAWGYAVAFRFDPNSGDPEPRKAIGREMAVSGQQVQEMLRRRRSEET